MLIDNIAVVAAVAVVAITLVGFAALAVNLAALTSVYLLSRPAAKRPVPHATRDRDVPDVLIQLPVYNERNVVQRVLMAAAAQDWPRERLRIQVLDDSDDGTDALTTSVVAKLCRDGV